MKNTVRKCLVLFSYSRKEEDYKKFCEQFVCKNSTRPAGRKLQRFYEQSRRPVPFAKPSEKNDDYKKFVLSLQSGDELNRLKKYVKYIEMDTSMYLAVIHDG